jgi:hypothetical protein
MKKLKHAGRPRVSINIKKRPISLKLSGWLLDWMDKQKDNRAQLIEHALIQTHNLKPPSE